MLTHSKQTDSTGKLTQLYIISLSAIAGLAILGQVFIQKQLAQQSLDLRIISAAQTRQTLCQRLLKTSLAVQIAPTPEIKQQRLAELQSVVSQWEASRLEVKDQMQSAVSKAQFAEVEPVFNRLEPAAQEILATAEKILEFHSSPATPEPGRQRLLQRIGDPDREMLGPRLLAAERVFTTSLDEIITWHNQNVKERVATLQALEFGLLGLTLLVLVAEGILIFRPAVKKLQQTLLALAQSLQEVQEKSHRLALEQEKSERLLLNILPEPIADRLKQEPAAIADGFGEVTVLFADVVGFTELSGRLPPKELVARLNDIFSRFDALAEKHGLEKIKTIGDAYMVVGGLPNPRDDHARAIAEMALDMKEAIQALNRETGESFNMRMGINSGPVVAGVIGIKKFIYDLWGDTVNVASRMESHGTPGEIQMTAATYSHLKDYYDLQERGTIAIKGKGEMTTYWLKGRIPTRVKA